MSLSDHYLFVFFSTVIHLFVLCCRVTLLETCCLYSLSLVQLCRGGTKGGGGVGFGRTPPSETKNCFWSNSCREGAEFGEVNRLGCRDVVSVLNVSVSRRSRDVSWNVSVSSRSWRYNVYVVSVSGFVTFGLVNIHARLTHIYQEENNGSDSQETGCQVTDFTS